MKKSRTSRVVPLPPLKGSTGFPLARIDNPFHPSKQTSIAATIENGRDAAVIIEPIVAGALVNGLGKFNDNLALAHPSKREEPKLLSSHPKDGSLSIDLILFYDSKAKPSHSDDNQSILSKKRERFEGYLQQEHSLVLERASSSSSSSIRSFVKIHTPFDSLLQAARKTRMRLPIQKIENEDDLSHGKLQNKSRWFCFKRRCTQPFRLDPSFFQDEPEYYKAVCSRNIPELKDFLTTLRASEKEYFTPSERSLLTHALLSQVHYIPEAIVRKTFIREKLDAHNVYPAKRVPKSYGIDLMVAEQVYHGYFPLHEPLRNDVRRVNDADLNDREKLQKHWATMRCWYKFQPLPLIRSYMGEKVAFYFAFTGFYNLSLIFPAIIGLIVFIYGASSAATDQSTSDICGTYGSSTYMCPRCDKSCPFWKLSDSCVYSKISYVFDNVATVIFAGLMSLWARLFVELWKRREAVRRYDWDSIDFEENLEPVRPKFEQEAKERIIKRKNPVTGELENFVRTRERAKRYLGAAAFVLVMVAIVCATVFATIVYRIQIDYLLKKTSVKAYSSIIITVTSALMNLICSLSLSKLFYWIAGKLTDREMHRYQSTYDDSLVIKIYLFQFVSFYASLFYVAFFKGRFLEYPSTYGDGNPRDFTEQCDPAGCLVELSIQLLIIMVGNQIISLAIEYFFAMGYSPKCCYSKKKSKNMRQWEKDNELKDFKSTTLVDEYLDLVIQFGFVTLFAVAFPLAPLFALVKNLTGLRLDAWKFLSKYKRPIPCKASKIGIWSDIISAISHFAVLTNAIIIAWTSEFIPKMTYRVTQSTGGSLVGYVNWTLSSFPISDYNATGTMPSGVPTNLTYCRYRDFRDSTGPSYTETSLFWNVTAARLAFVVVFEHMIFFVIYALQWAVHGVPQSVKEKIDHERYIDQQERWASKSPRTLEDTTVGLRALRRIASFDDGDMEELRKRIRSSSQS